MWCRCAWPMQVRTLNWSSFSSGWVSVSCTTHPSGMQNPKRFWINGGPKVIEGGYILFQNLETSRACWCGLIFPLWVCWIVWSSTLTLIFYSSSQWIGRPCLETAHCSPKKTSPMQSLERLVCHVFLPWAQSWCKVPTGKRWILGWCSWIWWIYGKLTRNLFIFCLTRAGPGSTQPQTLLATRPTTAATASLMQLFFHTQWTGKSSGTEAKRQTWSNP